MNTIEKMIRARRATPEFGWGAYQVLDVDAPEAIAHVCSWRGNTVVAFHNLADQECTVRFEIDDGLSSRQWITVLEDQEYPGLDDGANEVTLGPYGYRWLRVEGTRR